MNTMRLPKFLSEVDNLTDKMSKDELRAYVHEMARTWSESRRKSFIELLSSYSGSNKNPGNKCFNDDKEEFIAYIDELIEVLEDIEEGCRCLDSEYNEMWDDWYDNDEDEVIFKDPDDIADDINDAIKTIHSCIDKEIYRDALQLALLMSVLEVQVTGDYCDCGDDLLDISDLCSYDIISCDFKTFVNECLYINYMGSKESERAESLFVMMHDFGYSEAKIEDLLQMGNNDLPNFDKFLKEWIEYLGDKDDQLAARLLKEALGLLKDDEAILNNARRYADIHPSLYKECIELGLKDGKISDVINIGIEALKNIPDKYIIREEIALLTLNCAEKTGNTEIISYCKEEAFISNTNFINYLRLKMSADDWEMYRDMVNKKIASLKEKSGDTGSPYVYYSGEFRENKISDKDYYFIRFFEGDFDWIRKHAMNVKEPLGWSGSFMKTGISLILLLLYNGTNLPKGLSRMQMRVIEDCGFSAETYYGSLTNREDENEGEIFGEIFNKWKKKVYMSEDKENEWIDFLKKIIAFRTEGIMNGNKRNYYGECAEFIAALGEVTESLGERQGKENLMMSYKLKYPRRRAFHQELRNCGMIH